MIRSLLLKNSRKLRAVLLLLMLTAAGCSKTEPPTPPAPSTKAEPVKVLPMPVQKQISSVVGDHSTDMPFDFSNKKDPFKPFIEPKSALPVAATPSRKSLLPIHSYDVRQFRVIGVVMGGKVNQAMVIDPSGKGYVLKAGMTIGKNEGRVTAIASNGIEVLEQFRDDNGRVRKERIKITLPRKE